jgi:hypothetical protein
MPLKIPITPSPLNDPLLSSIYFEIPQTYFRDYGYRLMHRFSHAYYMSPPMHLEKHIIPLVPEISTEKYKFHFQDMPNTASGR